MDTFTATYDEKVRPLMDKIDKIRPMLSGGIDGVEFPTVVVVGDQSSGKSTLLEALSLVELPKGSGIVTRCPLILRLRKSTESNVYHLHGENKRTLLNSDELDIAKYIEHETNKLAGTEKNIVKDLIELEIEHPSVRDLTVVDLPGISRNPIADQPKDIHNQTTNLIRHFIQQEGTIILCVFPANVDVATVESFTLAREVDPSGLRTIGVITKSDLSPNPDVLCEQLLMERKEVLHLKLGFIAVRNRTADENISLENARKREKKFFEEHVASSVVGWHCLGVDSLINRLADLYADRVIETYPKIRADIQNKLDSVHEQLMKFPAELDSPSRLTKYHELADYYLDNFIKLKMATISDKKVGLVNVLEGKFQNFNGILNDQTIELETPEYASKVQRTMLSASGEQLANFMPHYLLKHFINEKIDQLWSTTKNLINDCFAATFSLLLTPWKCDKDLLLQKLLPAFGNIVKLHLAERKKIVHDQLEEMTRLEKCEPYTMNNSYMDTLSKYKKVMNTSCPLQLQEMICSVRGYWDVVRKRFVDYATLTIRAAFMFDVYNGVRERLRRIPSEQCDFVDIYFGDDAHTREQRKKIQQTYDRLEKILAILGGRKSTVRTKIEASPTGNELDTLRIILDGGKLANPTETEASTELDTSGIILNKTQGKNLNMFMFGAAEQNTSHLNPQQFQFSANQF